MEVDTSILQYARKMMMARYPRFASQLSTAHFQFKRDLPCKTAGTDGKNVYFDPDYFASLNDEEKLFVVAHELMHIKFEHMFRMADKNGEMRDMELWNIATDAIINANLVRDGFTMKEGYVDMPEAVKYNAETLYEILLKKREEEQKEQQSSENQNPNGDSNNSQGDGQPSGQNGEWNNQPQNQQQSGANGNGSTSRQLSDDHSIWEEAFKKRQKEQSSFGSKQKAQPSKDESEQSQISSNDGEGEFDESEEFEKNRQTRRAIAKKKMEEQRENGLRTTQQDGKVFGNLGSAKPVLDWKNVLKKEFEKTESIWSQRRSIAENNYAFRMEDYELDERARSEVMIDSSGSVSDGLVKAFIRQLKPLLKESDLFVGFFATDATTSFQEIKTDDDIDRMRVYRPGCTTNMDAAVRAFTKKREINKIVFTDGYATNMPQDDLKGMNVLWLVYGNDEFKPCCGKVINVDIKGIERSISMLNDTATCDEECIN